MEEGEAGWEVGDGGLIVFAIAEKFPRLNFPRKLYQAASTANHGGCGRRGGVVLGWPLNFAALLELREIETTPGTRLFFVFAVKH